ncbi:hypothetical protein, partial [Bacillus subtilis]
YPVKDRALFNPVLLLVHHLGTLTFFTNDKILQKKPREVSLLRLNIYTIIFIILAIASNLISIFVFHQGILAYVLAIIFLLVAGYSTKFTKPKDQNKPN